MKKKIEILLGIISLGFVGSQSRKTKQTQTKTHKQLFRQR